MSFGSSSTALVLLFVLIASVTASIVTGILVSTLRASRGDDTKAALDVLRRRLAAGEIDEEEYLKRRSTLDV